MNLKEFKEIYTKVYLKTTKVPTVLLVSAAGVGKTSIIEEIAKENGYRLQTFRAAEHEAVDLIGMPEIVEVEKKAGIAKKTKFIEPDWVPEWDEKFILFCDEVNRGRIDVRQAIFRIAEGRGTETWKFNPEKHKVILAVNPDNGSYQVEGLDTAFLNRLSIFYIEPDINTFLAYMVKNNKNENVRNFLGMYPQMLLQEPPEDSEITQHPSPRSWDYLSEIIDAISINENTDITKNILQSIMGTIGKEAGAAFVNFLKDKDFPLTVKEVLEFNEEAEKKLQKHIKEKKNDKVMATLLNTAAYVEVNNISSAQWKSVKSWFDSLENDEFKMVFLEIIASSSKYKEAITALNPKDISKFIKLLEEKRKKMMK